VWEHRLNNVVADAGVAGVILRSEQELALSIDQLFVQGVEES